ncbi:ATP-binding protein [Mariniphaga sp.]|uniref:ATP-binding protein n=1 Tax=Mariniphaga sp. TaxID=1954475 RepID=UPI0035699F52
MIYRYIQKGCLNHLAKSRKIMLIYGPRQAGKTTLVKNLEKESGLRALYLSADLSKNENLLIQRDLKVYSDLTEGYQLLIIDEAQRVPDIGLVLKIMYDEMPHLKVIATGSSSFDLANSASEPLTGRKRIFHLLPLSLEEISDEKNKYEFDQQLEDLLIYGLYPEVYTSSSNEKKEMLEDISESYLFKDVLQLTTVKYIAKIRDLLRLIAFQVGQQVSIHELTNKLGINRETVERYIDLLEKAFVIFRLPAFSRNPRNEVSKMDKIYFYDNGIRNILIDNLKPFDLRTDVGNLWENFIVAERRKQILYHRKNVHSYFWRTYSGTEIDYVEETDTGLAGYEIKLNKDKFRIPKAWKTEYNGELKLINRKCYLDFLLKNID